MYVCHCYFPHSSHPLSPTPSVHMFILYVCIFIPANGLNEPSRLLINLSPFKTSSVGIYLLNLYSHNSKKFKSCAHSTSGIAKRQTPNLTHPAKVKVAVFWKICMHPNIWVGLLSFDIFCLTRAMDRLSYITVGEEKKTRGK